MKLCEDLKEHSLSGLEGKEYYGEYLAKTDKMGADVPNPVSHVAYGYATQLCALNEDGTVKKMAAAHALGKAVNPLSVEGQIEGGVVMGMGFALTEKFPLEAVSYTHLDVYKRQPLPTSSRSKHLIFWTSRPGNA